MPTARPFLGFLFATGGLLMGQDGTRLLEGRVVDVLGDPIPAATVQLVANGRPPRTATTDGEGVYRLRAPTSGALLLVSARGKVTERLAWRGIATPNVRNLVLEDAAVLRGRVTNALGERVAQALVVAAANTASATTMTDADGR
ncbi:MAG: carboxypeptidase regulatory-like domain-containing protein, partial [Planctomycetes bacterium]|nr:carboxypeptidase regulatory-like domain-containing protein [Planctomycetota bacterium]